MTDNNRHTPPRRPQRLRLPFDNRREDAGEWAYDHRVGLCVTIIVYLLLGIAFVGSKITLGTRSHTQGVYIDLHTVDVLEDERDRLQQEVRRNNSAIDWKSIRNAQSNDNALNENLADDRGTRTSELNAKASDVSADMRANRDAYERGLAEADELGRRAADDGTAADEKLTDRKLSNVTVTFSLKDPVRYKRDLAVPAYRCEGGGEVVVSITVDRGGRVVAASVVSGGDECMRDASVQAARASLFNIDESAPARQTGTITYIFIPQ